MITIEIKIKKSEFNGKPMLFSKVVSVDADESAEIEQLAIEGLQFEGHSVISKSQIETRKAHDVKLEHLIVSSKENENEEKTK